MVASLNSTANFLCRWGFLTVPEYIMYLNFSKPVFFQLPEQNIFAFIDICPVLPEIPLLLLRFGEAASGPG